jgi:cytochrome oxidase Cu insertion factor (SCO1/SenC/PrrC family)
MMAPGANSRRLRLAVALLAGLVLLGAGVFFGLAHRDQPRGAAGTMLASAIGGSFRLVDQNGKRVTDADLRGKWSLVYFGYTHCPDACPTALNDIAIALDELGPKRDAVRPVFITVDPERDTPEVLKSYVTSFDAPILALSGTPEEVAQAEKPTASIMRNIRKRAATTRWTTVRSSMSWIPRAASPPALRIRARPRRSPSG